MPAPEEIQEKVSPAAQSDDAPNSWGDISRAVTEAAIAGAVGGAGAAAAAPKDESKTYTWKESAEQSMKYGAMGLLGGGAAAVRNDSTRSVTQSAAEGAIGGAILGAAAMGAAAGAAREAAKGGAKNAVDGLPKFEPMTDSDRKGAAQKLMEELAAPRTGAIELIQNKEAPKALASDLPADINTVAEFKQVGADHGKETASRKAEPWTITSHADGVEVWKNSETGTKMSKLPDGTNITEFKNGNISIIRKDETSITRNGETGVTTYNRPDGSGVLQFKDGRQELIAKPDPNKDPYGKAEFKAQPDGSKVYENPYVKVTRTDDGKQVELLKETGVTNTTTKDGSKVTEYPNGLKISKLADGTELTVGKDYSMKKMPDGTVFHDETKSKYQFSSVTQPDGSSVTKFNNGDVGTMTKDGAFTRTKPDGSSVTEFKNGDIVTKTADGKETKSRKEKK